MIRLGFVGIGQMGKRMARNLLKAGYPLTIYNRSAGPAEELVKLGAEKANAPSDVGEKSDIVLLSLTTPQVVESVVLGKNGVAERMKSGKVIIDTSTIDPQSARDLAHKLNEKGITFLDSPVSGGPEKAENATLTLMVGGDRDAFDRCMPVFTSMGKNIFYMGASSAGEGTKLVNQILTATNSAITAEAFEFGAALGLDLENVEKVIEVSAGDSAQFRRTFPLMLANDFKLGWQTYIMQKDLGLVLKAASEMKTPMLLSSLTHELLTATSALGYEKNDPAILIKLLQKMSGGSK